jgi:excisionase family DNA binding protein
MHQMHHAPGDPDDYLSRAQVADLFNVSPSTVTRWAEEGKLAHVRTLGGHRRYFREDILQLLRTLTKEERMETMTAEIPRLYGDHHVNAVHQVLAELAGVHAVWASAATRRLTVIFDPELLSHEAILARLAERGYPTQNGHAYAEKGEHHKDPAWAQLGLRMTQTHPAER